MCLAEPFPARCKKYVWIGRMNLDVNDARVVVNVKHLFPGFSPVYGLVETSFFVFGVQSTHGTNPHDVGIGRVNLNLPGVLGVE